MATLALNPLKFEDIKAQVIQYLTAKNDYSGQFDFSSSNLSYFIDTMAYVTMLVSYNTTHVANNMFLDTTDIRKNAVSLAKQMGYKPKRPYSARLQGKLIYKGVNFNSSNKLIIPARSPFTGEFGNIYQNLKPITLTYKGNPTQLESDYVLTEGTFHTYKAFADGTSNFSFTIDNPNIDEDNFSLYVLPSTVDSQNLELTSLTNYSQYRWNMVKTFFEIVSNNIFFVEEDIVKEGYAKVIFGNGAIGNIPTSSDTIICEYLETKGAAANFEGLISLPPADTVGVATTSYLYYIVSELGEENKVTFSPSNFDTTTFQNPYNKSFGGTDLEGIDSIKYNAPRFYSFVGRTVSKNDYIYYLNSLPGIKSANVTSGMELYPNDETKLGNIYLSMVPNVSQSEFIYGNNIYLDAEFENDIKVKLDDYSIISTKRHIYKPTYVIVDITPNIEIGKNIPKSEQNKLQDQIKNLLDTHFLENFDTLGVVFRESKISAVIDTLPTITSSYLDLVYSFVLNNRTVENLIENVNNYMYLPVRNVKDETGAVTGFTNFIKTNTQIIKEDLLPDVDWSIMDKAYVTDAEQILLNEKTKLLNNTLFNIPKENCSISSTLLTPTLNRFLYNRDFKDTEILNLWFVNNTLRNNTSSFKDVKNDEVQVSVIEKHINGNHTKFIQFSKFDTSANSVFNYEVARIVYTSYAPYNINLALDDYIFEGVAIDHRANLLDTFGIDESSYVFENLPFEIIQTDDTHYTIKMRLHSYTTQLVIDGKNTLFNIFKAYNSTPSELHQVNTYGTKVDEAIWKFKHVNDITSSYGTITYNKIDNARVELSHHTLQAHNDKFRGFIANEVSYLNIINTLNTYSTGDYWIVLTFFSSYGQDGYSFFKKDDILFKNSAGELQRATIKKNVSATDASELVTKFIQGDTFVDDIGSNDYLMFDTGAAVDPYNPNFKPIVMKNLPLDASQAPPKNLRDNQIIRLVVSDSAPYRIYYQGTTTNKLQAPFYKRNGTGTDWITVLEGGVEDKVVYDGDIIVYSESSVNGGGWFLVENVYNSGTTHRIEYGAAPIVWNALPSLSNGWAFMALKAAENLIIPEPYLPLFNNPPADGMLNSGDIIILTPDGTWSVFDDDYFDFQIDVLSGNSSFPEPLAHGDVYTISALSDTTVSNFQGKTQTVSFAQNEEILYVGNDEWVKFTTPTVTYTSVAGTEAIVGDLVKVIDAGNFENSPKLDVPAFENNFMFGYNDLLYYTGVSWIKAFPINIYNITGETDVINTAGYNSDYFINFGIGNYYDICLNDIYHDAIIGELDYYTGKLELFPSVSGKLNKLEYISSDGVANKLSSIFKLENYMSFKTQMDKIQFKPVRRNSNETETDFDTNFNQFLIANVTDTKIIK
jgi:hypothetical protein